MFQCNVVLSANATLCSPTMDLFQVYLHWYLHIRVSNKDISERFLYSAIHIFERSVELAGLHGDYDGVSTDIMSPLHTSSLSSDSLTLCLYSLVRGRF